MHQLVRRHPLAVTAILVGALTASTCSASSTDLEGTMVSEGTWGGNDVGLIVTATLAHVHFGCTNGDFEAPLVLDADGRFSVSGDYVIDAYPVATGPPFPAQLAGTLRGREITMTVAVNDTINDELVVFGPSTVRLDREPSMTMCPICETPE